MNLDLSDTESVVAWLHADQGENTSMIDLSKLMLLIRTALDLDGHAIDFDALFEIFAAPLDDYMDRTGNSSGDPKNHLIYPTMVYLHYANWEEAITKRLGVNVEADIQPDWKAQHPHTGAAMKALSAIGLRVMLSGSKAYEEHNGHSMMEVLMLSCETGEGFDQSRARLTAKRSGLGLVKG